MVGTVVARMEVEVRRGKEGKDCYIEEERVLPPVSTAERSSGRACLPLLQAFIQGEGRLEVASAQGKMYPI